MKLGAPCNISVSTLRGWRLTGILLVVGGVVGCQNLAGVDRSLVNHPAMDFSSRRIPAAQSILSPLDNAGAGNVSAGCVTCVH